MADVKFPAALPLPGPSPAAVGLASLNESFKRTAPVSNNRRRTCSARWAADAAAWPRAASRCLENSKSCWSEVGTPSAVCSCQWRLCLHRQDPEPAQLSSAGANPTHGGANGGTASSADPPLAFRSARLAVLSKAPVPKLRACERASEMDAPAARSSLCRVASCLANPPASASTRPLKTAQPSQDRSAHLMC